jgi:lipoprotein-anchoring transpeptidase ErfK/SrfK
MSYALMRAVGPRVRRRAPLAALLLPAVALTLLISGCGPAVVGVSSTTAATASAGADQPTGGGSPATGNSASTPLDQGSSLVATALGGRLTVRTGPGQGTKRAMSNPTPTGGPLTFLVVESRPDWLKVLLPQRPNGSTGWVARADVSLAVTPYRLVISMKKHRLDVVYQGKRVASHPVGVGKVATPTPNGTYYLTELIQLPDPSGAYGPYAFGLSAFSSTLTTFAGGPGQIGLHGTDAPHGLGHDVSHGCLRVSNAVITQLAERLPLGTPVEIHA